MLDRARAGYSWEGQSSRDPSLRISCSARGEQARAPGSAVIIRMLIASTCYPQARRSVISEIRTKSSRRHLGAPSDKLSEETAYRRNPWKSLTWRLPSFCRKNRNPRERRWAFRKHDRKARVSSGRQRGRKWISTHRDSAGGGQIRQLRKR